MALLCLPGVFVPIAEVFALNMGSILNQSHVESKAPHKTYRQDRITIGGVNVVYSTSKAQSVYCQSTQPNAEMVSTLENAQKQAREIAKEQAREIAQQMSQECVARRLRQVNRTVTRLYDKALRPYGLTVNQLNILAVVISEKQIRPGQLGQALGMEKSTVSRTVDRMVSKGWLKTIPGEDSRTQLLSVSAKGTQLLLSVTDIWDALQAGVLTHSNGGSLLQMLTIGHQDPQFDDESVDDDGPISADDFYL